MPLLFASMQHAVANRFFAALLAKQHLGLRTEKHREIGRWIGVAEKPCQLLDPLRHDLQVPASRRQLPEPLVAELSGPVARYVEESQRAGAGAGRAAGARRPELEHEDAAIGRRHESTSDEALEQVALEFAGGCFAQAGDDRGLRELLHFRPLVPRVKLAARQPFGERTDDLFHALVPALQFTTRDARARGPERCISQ